MTDVHDLLARTHRALGDAEAPLDVARHDALLTGVRRRRRRRHAGEALVATALAVVLGTGGWWYAQRTDRAPLPADRARPAPTATAEAPHFPGLPPAQVLPDGLLASTTPGWVLVTVNPGAYGDDAGSVTHAQVVDLVSPDGDRYRVADLTGGPPTTLVRWDAGDRDALVTVRENGDRPQGARLDLPTGRITLLAGLETAEQYLGRTADGDDLWDDPTKDRIAVHDGTALVGELPRVATPLADPEGRWVAGTGDGQVVLLDVTTGKVAPATPASDVPCVPLVWRGTDLLVSCVDDAGGEPQVTATLRVDVTDPDAEPQPLPVGDLVPAGVGAPLADGRVAVAHSLALECGHGWGVLDVDTGTLTDVPVARGDGEEVGVVDVSATGQVALVTVLQYCSGDGGPARVLRHDLATGTEIEVGHAPPTTDLPPGARWTQVTTSAVLAGP